MRSLAASSQFRAVLLAVWAALTAIEIGIENVNSRCTSFVCTIAILAMACGLIVPTSGL
jgi:uncharacterized membrane protein